MGLFLKQEKQYEPPKPVDEADMANRGKAFSAAVQLMCASEQTRGSQSPILTRPYEGVSIWNLTDHLQQVLTFYAPQPVHESGADSDTSN